ncbi:TonB-dependent receptor [Pedobacter nyackensis]|nr:TonB-dependent receptor [Pedobacter nyackensis]
MKLTMVLLIATIMQVSATGFAQKITLKQNDISLVQLFNAIRKQTGYNVLWIGIDAGNFKRINVDFNNVPLNEVLKKSFENQPLVYEIENRTVIVTKNKRDFVNNNKDAYVDIDIRGRVVDAEGKPLPGASVKVKSIGKAVITDIDGSFQLKGIDEGAILEISFVGYVGVEIKASKDLGNIVLKLSDAKLDEIVVVGYGKQKKTNLTSAITVVNTERLENRSIPKLSTGLQGLTPGVNIRQQTGRPGYAASTFDIRGASMGTFSSNPPLVLIDGIVDDINNVNPNDVDQISILKDAAAASIYGSRSTGGVVLITTKRGSSGAPTVSFSSILGFQNRPLNNYKLLNTAEWMRANNEAAHLDGSPDVFSATDIAKYDNSTDTQFPVNSQWADWIKKSAIQQNHNINIKGGTEKLNFYGSAGYVKQGGFVANDDYRKMNFLLNLNYKATSRLEISTNVSYIKEDVTRPATGIGDTYAILRNSLMTIPTTPFRLANGDYNNATMWGNNPAYLIENGGNGLYDYDLLRMGLTAKYKIIEGLSLRYTTAANMNFSAFNNINKKIPYRNNDGVIYGYNIADVSVSESWSKSLYLNNQLMLDYNKQWKEHTLTMMAGVTSEDQRADNISASATQFPNNEIREVAGTTGTGNQISGSSSATDWSIASVIGRLNYAYKNKYLLETSLRYDGSSRFSPNRRWGLFPSVSAGWRLVEENFLRNVNFLSDLKLRASWGELGNQGTSLYPFAQNVSTAGRYAFGNSLTAVATLGAPAYLGLTWEKKKTTNIGLDFGFFKNRLSGSFDYFYDRTRGIIGSPTVPSTFGASAPVQNTYVINNRGFEFDIKWSDKIGSIKYFVGFNLSDSRDEVISLGGIGTTDSRFGNGLVQLSGSSYLHEGEARNHFYLYKTNGLFVDQNEINNHAFISSLTRPGDISFTDINGDGKLTPADMVGDKRTSTPHYFYGFNMGLEFKGFDLSAVISGVGQRWDFRNNGGTYLTGVRASLAIMQGNYDNRWTEANPNKWADQPRLTQNNWIANSYSTLVSAPNEYHLRNFAYLRVKNLQLGYTLPVAFTKGLALSKVRLNTTMENVFTLTPGYKENIDPESVLNFTSDGSAFFGQPRVISFGLSVTF